MIVTTIIIINVMIFKSFFLFDESCVKEKVVENNRLKTIVICIIKSVSKQEGQA